MFTSHLLKRFLPFALALLCGLALWALLGPRFEAMKDVLYLEHDLSLGGQDAGQHGGGPGGGPADYGRTFSARDVTRKAVLLSRPEPGFTEEARKNNITGTVRLRMALGADGTVSNILVIKGLPDGLTERAIEAAKRIQFTPAQKDGRNVSQWVTVEYNFNIY
jgi:TonB family protein